MRGIQKGLYIEQKKNRSVFLMSDGRFMHGEPTSSLSIGEEGYFYPFAAKPQAAWKPIFAPAIALAAVVLLFLSSLLPSDDAFAYVQLEMDSSIEFGVDKAIRVISVRELNGEGQKLIGKLGDWKGEALDKLIERSIAISVKDNTEKVTITLAAEKSTDTASVLLKEMVLTASAAAANKNIDVHMKEATLAQWEKSIEENIPVGQKVEQFTPYANDENSGADRMDEIKENNDIKALKMEKSQSSVKNKKTDAKVEVKTKVAPQAKAASQVEAAPQDNKEQALVKKEEVKTKPLKKPAETPAKVKKEKFEPPAKAEQAKPAAKKPKAKAFEKKLESKPAPNVNVKPAAAVQPKNAQAKPDPKKPLTDKPQPNGADKLKQPAKPKPKVEKIQKDKPKVQANQKDKPSKVQAEKPVKAEVQNAQQQLPKQVKEMPKSNQKGKKQEQK